MKKYKNRTFKKNDDYRYEIRKSMKKVFTIYIIFIIVFRIAIGQTLNFQTYELFYNCWLFLLIILLGSLCIFILGIRSFVKYNKDPKIGILLLINALLIACPVFMLSIFSPNGRSLMSWTKDLHYALMNNPPSITDELKVKMYKEYVHADPARSREKDGSLKIVGFNEKAELKVGDKTFNVNNVGKIKKFLDTHKEGSKVKAVYMPECNILISLEED